MGEIVSFKKPDPRKKVDGKTLCRSGHHKWAVDKAQRFDTKQGRLVTVYRCERCGKTRVKGE